MESVFKLPTLEEIKAESNSILEEIVSGKTHIDPSLHHGMKAQACLNIEPKDMVIDTLHMKMGLVKTFFKPNLDTIETRQASSIPNVGLKWTEMINNFLKTKINLNLLEATRGWNGEQMSLGKRFSKSMVNYNESSKILNRREELFVLLETEPLLFSVDELLTIKSVWDKLFCLISLLTSEIPCNEFQWRYLTSNFSDTFQNLNYPKVNITS